ncbi:Major facilitator superfamily domain general substrate transporter [Penicillium capsulatum]|uniref:Major facilitator superfamily domain general substrate transporter n=1 Tax=Penicillium capsulatum TaxID=69766 RepID=A0A9W9LHG0_9EURO|nr:Major facilitator superfamily domain general substrate transporter [Penicillium capsulatum]KAJ6106201.1 Major facilitator superfamily domain general substrate transporter [Penicillium capsulatum]
MAVDIAKSGLQATTISKGNSAVIPNSAPKVPDQFADESFKLFSRIQATDPTPEEAQRIRNKCLWRILPFLCIGYHLMYVDKQTLGSSAILGIMDDAHLNSNQYNWLSSIFYFGYLLAEWPQNWALQKFPVAKWLAGNLVIWGGITLLHIPCNNFASLFVVRAFLGVAEASIVPAFLLSMSMFFTYGEQAVMMPIMWSIGNASPISSGLLSYGVLWIDTGSFSPWRWFMVITGGLTIVFGTFVYFLFPDSPLHAGFLTDEEREQAVLRIKDNHSGIEQKKFKRYQFLEAIQDPKTWLFFLHSWSQEMANGITNQYSLIINSFGFTVLQTTLLGTVSGLVSFFCLGSAAVALYHTRNCRAWISLLAYIPGALSSILLLALPWSNHWGLISGIWIRSTTGVPYAVVMIWAANASAGHTKKTTVIALYHIGYGLGNIISPQLFRPKWKPRYRPTWIILLVVAAILPSIIIIVLRIYLSRENKRRDKLEAADQVTGRGVVETTDSSGAKVTQVVDNSQMDLTDRENLKFRYVL